MAVLPGLVSASFALAVGGCSVDVVQVGASAQSPSASGPMSTATGKPSDVSTRIDVPDPADEEESEDPLQYARRSYYDDKFTATVDCAGGEVVVAKSDQVVHITQDCAKVVIRADYTDLVAEHVGTLIVEEAGEFSYVLVRGADTVNVAADMTDVWWDEGNPGVTVSGFDSHANPNPARQ